MEYLGGGSALDLVCTCHLFNPWIKITFCDCNDNLGPLRPLLEIVIKSKNNKVAALFFVLTHVHITNA